MKKFLLFGTILVVATGAFAFGGIGIGKLQRHKSSSGVDAIGIHIDPNGKKADIDILEPCPDGLEHNSDGSCTVCANGNVYLSYMDDPCGTETPMNQVSCESDNDCVLGESGTNCCDLTTHVCRAGIYNLTWEHAYVCPEQNTVACKNNTDCQSGEFCNVIDYDFDYLPDTGTCQSLDEGTEYTWNNTKFLVSQNMMPWWGVDNWCKAHGKKLAKAGDLVDTTILPITDGYYECEGSDCEGVDWEALSDVFGYDYYWLGGSTHPENEQMIGANANSSWSAIGYDGRPVADYYALCK